MVLTMVPVTARAATSGTHGTDITWSLDGTVLTFSGTGAMTANPISGNSEWRSVTSVKIESGITTVGPYAFAGCDKLVSVEIPGTVTRILYNAFENCTSLTSVTIPTGVASIEEYAFYNCAGLTSVAIPDTVTSIGVNAFGNCTSLKSLTTSASKIGTSAFSGCTALERAVLKAPLQDCGTGVFDSCQALEIVELAEGTTTIAEGMFYGCAALTGIQIPASVTAIRENAFRNSALKTVVFSPDSNLTTIGSKAFFETLISYQAGGVPGEITLPKKVTTIGGHAFGLDGGGGETIVTFVGNPPSTIDAYAFEAMRVTFRYPYGNAAWESVKGKDYGATAATWTAYGTTTLTFGPTTTDSEKVEVVVYSSDLPFNTAANAGDFLVHFDTAPPDLELNEVAVDGKTLTLTFGPAVAGEEVTAGAFSVNVKPSAFAALRLDENGVELEETIRVVYDQPSAPPSTIEGFDPNNKCSLAIDYPHADVADTKPLVSLYQVASVDVSLNFKPVGDFNNPSNPLLAGLEEKLADTKIIETGGSLAGLVPNLQAAAELGNFAKAGGGPRQTDSSGQVLFTGLQPGLYLVTAERYQRTEDDGKGGTQTVICAPVPYLICLPSYVLSPDKEWIYDVTSTAMYSESNIGRYIDIHVFKVWDDQNDSQNLRPESVTVALMRDGKIMERVTLHKGNNWRYDWENLDNNGSDSWSVTEMGVPDGYRYTVSKTSTSTGLMFEVVNTCVRTTDPPDAPSDDKPSTNTGGGGTTKPPADKETIPLPEDISTIPKDNPPSPVQDIVKKDKVYTEYVKWIERVEPPEFATDLYDVLVSGADEEDTRFADCLTEDKYFTIDPSADGKENADVETVEEVEFALSELYGSTTGGLSSVIFENDDFFIVNVTKGDRGVSYNQLTLGDVVQTSAYNGVFVVSIPKGQDYDAKKKEVCSYIAAVFQAFDRDHPEVFWLSGKCKVRIATVGGQAYFFLSLADAKGFTMRAPDWTAPGAVANGLRRRETAVQRILATVGSAGTSQEQLRALNRYLTEHNEYNTSADLNAIGNEPHECLAALEGRAGNSGPVCDGYARAFKVVCDRLNIPCVLENGYAKSSPGGGGTFHMWNSVELGGSWFGVDVTWNDPVVRGVSGAKSGHENERYFLVGANTDILGMSFAASHPVTNQAAVGGVAFDNGPALSPVAFSAMTHQSRNSVGAMEFQDVPIWEWFANCVAYACERGLMTGVSEERFAPNRNLSREMLWMILYRLDGNTSRELEDTRRWAVAQELSDGSAPLAAITREQMVTTLYRYCKRKGYRIAPGADLSRFPDSGRVEEYAREAFAWAVGCGLVGGTDEGLLAPQGYATRAQIAAILQRFEQCVK